MSSRLGNTNGANQPLSSDYSKLALSTGVSANLNGTIVATPTNPLNALDVFTVILSGAPVNGTFSNTMLVNGSTYSLDSGRIYVPRELRLQCRDV